ncbi:MAG: hypothetical protein A4E40_00637 [Methanoregulaceae archaeon PtaU1.Bin059]|nr:MAG: hypothetical protein A4E40_00637 [Methanoregulaceae archaeon PtaU1.Bin059]
MRIEIFFWWCPHTLNGILPTTAQRNPDLQRKKKEMQLTLAVPICAFGGLGLAILLQDTGIIADAADFYWGSVAASVILAYLAYLKPRRDIVSLFAPFYALLIFIVPLETKASLLLQALYALSITLLLVRLHYRFSTPKTVPKEEDPMEKYLYDYIHRMTPFLRVIDPATAHEIASAVLSFKFGLYAKVVTDVRKAASRLPKDRTGEVIGKALSILSDRARALEEARVGEFSPVKFDAGDLPYLPVVLGDDQVYDKDTLALDNALLLLYTAAYLQSPDDGQSLDEHQNFVIQILESYREPLNLK